MTALKMPLTSNDPALRAIAKVAFPQWRGRKVTGRVGLVHVGGTAWSGGSRNTFAAVELATGCVRDLPQSTRNPRAMGGTEPDGYVEVPPGFAVVEHSIFQGKDCGCTVTFGAPLALDANTAPALHG